MEHIIAVNDSDFTKNKTWLKSAMLHFANKSTQSSFQKFYFWLRGSKPSPLEVRGIFGKVITFSIPQGKGFPPITYKGYVIGSGFFERLLFSEDVVFRGVRHSCHFFKKDNNRTFRKVDKEKALKFKKKLQAFMRGEIVK